MNQACESTHGTMAAVLGLGAKQIDEALMDSPSVWVANYNCPGQTVISGTKEGVELAAEKLKSVGAKRVIPLQVHGAFHSGLMQFAADELSPYIKQAPLTHSDVGFVMNESGGFVSDLNQIRDKLTLQVSHSVRWEQGILAIEKAGVDRYIEIGCGKTLAGLNKKIGVLSPTFSVDKLADRDELLRQLETL